MSDEQSPELSTNDLIAQRREKLARWRDEGIAYPNTFRRDDLAQDLLNQFNEFDKDILAEKKHTVCIAGRMVLQRQMGKASFATLQDISGQLQVYLRQNELPVGQYDHFKQWDLGDILGVKGTLFKTNTGELSVRATHIELVSKSLRPLPDKFHGLHDQEQRYRQRYVDLIANLKTRDIFRMRSQIIQRIREFLVKRDFLEVETPMMQPIPGGAAAKPFITHHNALDRELYLRISPELYLKRLVVGGFERVFEINRNFRNEGLSTRHNPEFTMIEFYQAYANYHDLMDLTEHLLRDIALTVLGQTTLIYQGNDFDLSRSFERLSIVDAIVKYNPDIKRDDLLSRETAENLAKSLNIDVNDDDGLGKIQVNIFDETTEHQLIQPTFITEYPAEISPLARKNDDNPFITDRFELFIGGREIANGFSELNDPDDQAARFKAQVEAKDKGDDEAMHYDADYINALEYGMPPTAGEGIGIDRLVMFFTDQGSIRDVILFPQLRAE